MSDLDEYLRHRSGSATGDTYTVYEKDGTKYIKKEVQGEDKFFVLDNGTIADEAADPQPTDPAISRVTTGKQYIKDTDGKYYNVNNDTVGSVAKPQPNPADLIKVENTNYKKIYDDDSDRTGHEVWTDKKGHE